MDAITNTNTRNTTTDAELQQFRAFQDDKLRAESIAVGRGLASAERLLDDQNADASALAKITSRNLSLRDCFGRNSTKLGRDALAIVYNSGVGNRGGAYGRLRRLAALEGLVVS